MDRMMGEDPARLVNVGSFQNAMEAQMAKGMLESAGIECFLAGEHTNAVYPMMFRVRLQVRETDEGQACDLLADVSAGGRSGE